MALEALSSGSYSVPHMYTASPSFGLFLQPAAKRTRVDSSPDLFYFGLYDIDLYHSDLYMTFELYMILICTVHWCFL